MKWPTVMGGYILKRYQPQGLPIKPLRGLDSFIQDLSSSTMSQQNKPKTYVQATMLANTLSEDDIDYDPGMIGAYDE